MKRILFGCVAPLLLLAVVPPASADAPDQQDEVQVFARDVFVITGNNLVNPDAGTDPDAHLFNNAGVAMDIRWGQWRSATARSLAHRTGKRTDVRLEFEHLVPHGVYSVFYLTLDPDTRHPDCSHVERSLPLTAFHRSKQLPDASSFVAGGDGTASYRGVADRTFLDARQSVIQLVYQLDGEPDHPFPNKGERLTHSGPECRSSFGEDAMRQLNVIQQFLG